MKFYIEFMNPKDRDVILEWLDYGVMHGLGAWRNSGKGIFVWRELKPDYSAYDEEEEA